MRENALIVASLVTWSRHPSLLLRYPSVYSCCLATTRRGDETRWATRSRFGSARLRSTRLGSALLGTAQRKHRFVYYYVIAGACFDVTVLVWRKYSTVYSQVSIMIKMYFQPLPCVRALLIWIRAAYGLLSAPCSLDWMKRMVCR
jgi:hypothetical protein